MTSTGEAHRARPSKLKKIFSHGFKSKMIRKDGSLGSTVSLRTNASKADLGVPSELSLEEMFSRDGTSATFLRVYCERVRTGDHFKTIKVYGNSSAQRCVVDLVKLYYSNLGEPESFQLVEAFGRVVPLDNDAENPTLTFSEIKARPIPPDETIHTVFSSTQPGQGVKRRIELRYRTVPTDVLPPKGRSVDLSQVETTSPFKRSFSKSSFTLRDSRRHRMNKLSLSPTGPHLIKMRGQNPVKDIPVHDLSTLIEQPGTKEITIGSTQSADIWLYSPPGDEEYLEDAIFAKLVGSDQPITTHGPDILSGAVYLEPATNIWARTSSVFFTQLPSIYINGELITSPANRTYFDRRLLRPGDFICFGSFKHGNLFLFKDPRWVPDHRLELAMPSTVQSSNTNSTVTTRRSIQIQRENIHSDRSSDTDSPRETSTHQFGIRVSLHRQDKLPRSSCLRPVISGLFTSLLLEPTPLHSVIDSFSTSGWSKVDAWRSAALFAHLVRTTAGLIVHPNPWIPNKDIEIKSAKAIKEYATNHVKDMHALLFECHQNLIMEGENNVFPHLWLSLFCYDVAVYLSSGWLSHESAYRPAYLPPRPRRTSLPSGDANDSSGSSGSSSVSGQDVEQIPVLVELKDLAYRLADDSIRSVVKIAFEEISPNIISFYQDEASSPGSGRSKESGFSSTHTSPTNHSRLQERLNKFAKCFVNAFYPSGTDELERTTSSIPSSVFYRTSTDGSTHSGKVTMGQGAYCYRTRHRNSIPDGSDHSISTGTEDDDMCDQWSPRDSVQNKPFSARTEGITRLGTATESRIESIVWRQLLASLTHNILHAILSTATIPVDSNTGERLLTGINWLQQWLFTNKLEAHKRPLNPVVEFASLLATPKKQLIQMTWNNMRSMYPELHPSILKFIVDEYLVEPELRPNDAWQVDMHDETAANEDPFEVIGMMLDGWRSKECVNYQKYSQRSSPTYRPRNPVELFKLGGTDDLIRRLDRILEERAIGFQWKELLKQFPPMHSTSRTGAETEGALPVRPQSRQSNSGCRRASSSLGRRQNGKSNFPAAKRNGLSSSQSSFTPFRQMLNQTGSIDNTGADFNEFMRPAPSSFEPQRTTRTLLTEALKISQDSPIAKNETALYHLNQLIVSLTAGGFQQLKQNGNRPSTALDHNLESAYATRRRARNTLYESQPDMTAVLQQPDEVSDFPRLEPTGTIHPTNGFRPAFPVSAQEVNNLVANRRAYGSLWQINSASRNDMVKTPQNLEYSRNLLSLSRDFGKFRQTALSRGLDSLRSPMPESPTPTPRNPMHSAVGSSLGNLTLSGRTAHKPNIIIEENLTVSTASDTPSETDSLLLRRDDDLSDVVSRTAPINTIANVTLNRAAAYGYGLKLEDGLRTALDQPGVFVKEVTENGPAASSGEIFFGDRILAINGHDLTGMTYSEALKMLRESGTQATFTIKKCYLSDPELLLVRKDVLTAGN